MKSSDLCACRIALIAVFPLILLSATDISAIEIGLGPVREQTAQWLMETRGLSERQACKLMHRTEAETGLQILERFSLPEGTLMDFVEVNGAAAPGEPVVQHQGCGMFMSPHSEYGRKFWAEVEKRKGTPWYDNLMRNIGEAYDRGYFTPKLGPQQIANLQRTRRPGEARTRVVATPYRALVISVRFPAWNDRNPAPGGGTVPNWYDGPHGGWASHWIGQEGETPGGPLDGNGAPVGLVSPSWGDTHARVWPDTYPNDLDLINYWYTVLFDPSNPNSIKNYYFQNSHGHVAFTGDRTDVTGWLDSNHHLDRVPVGRMPATHGHLRQPGTPVIRPIGGSNRIAYASATSDNRVTVLFSNYGISGRTSRGNYTVESPVGDTPPTIIDLSNATVRADPRDSRRISIIGTATLSGGDSFQVTFDNGTLVDTETGSVDGTVSLSNTLLTTSDIVSTRAWNRLKSFCYYVHDHNLPVHPRTSTRPYQLRHIRNSAGRIDDVGGTEERNSDHEERPYPYDHDMTDHNDPNLGVFEHPNSTGRHNSGTFRSDVDRVLQDYGMSKAGYDRFIYLYSSDTGGSTFIPHASGSSIVVPEDAGLTLLAHELGHTFGLPDLYDTDFYWNARSWQPPRLETQAMGPYSVMAHGTRMDAWCKIAAGWLTPVDVTTDLVPAEIPEIEGTLENPVVLRMDVSGHSPFEYFLVENRNRSGAEYFGDPSPLGMYIYHCDMRFGQDVEKHFRVVLEQADGLYQLETTPVGQTLPGMGGDPWPGITDNRNFTQLSAPDSNSHGFYAGGIPPTVEPGTNFDSFVRIADISDAGALMTANLFVEPREVVVTGTSLAPADAAQAEADVPMLRLTFDNQAVGEGFGVSTGDVVIKDIRLDESGNSRNDGDVQRLTLYEDTDGDHAFNPSVDAALANGTFSGQIATISGLNFRVRLGTANARDMFVVYNISPTAQINPRISVGVGLATFDYIIPEIPGAVQQRERIGFSNEQDDWRFPIISGETVILEAPDILTVSPVNRAPAQVPRGTAGHEMLSLDLSVDHDQVIIDEVHIQEGGSSTVDADVEQAHLYEDANGDGQVDAGDTLLRSARFNTVGPDQIAIFENLGYTAMAGTPSSLLLVYDIFTDATIGETVNVTIPANTEIILEPIGGGPPDQVSVLNFPMSSGDSLITIGPNDIPGAPSSLTAQDTPNDEGGSIDLSWNRSPDDGIGNDNVSEYRVYRATSSGAYDYSTPLLTVAAINTDTYSAQDTTAATGITYYYVVRAWTGLAESADSNEASATAIDDLAPPAITTLTAQDTPNDNGGSIDLDWTGYAAPPDVDHYNIYRSTLPITTVAGLTPIAAVSNPAATSYTDATTTDGVDYYYAVTPVDTGGNEDTTVTGTGPVQSVNNLIPGPITTLVAQDTPNDDGGSIDLDWSAYSAPPDTDHYNVYRATSSFTNVGSATLVGTVNDPATKAYADATTTDGVDYWYAVTAVDTAGNEDPNVTPAGPVQSLNDLPPPAITVLVAQDTPGDTGGSIDLDWSAYSPPADTDHYNIYRSTSSFTNVGSATLLGTVSDPGTKTYTDATTTDGVDYYYAVTGVDVVGNEDPNVTPAGPVQSRDNIPPLPITTLVAQDTPNDDGGSIDLDWSAYSPPADADHYNVYRSTSSFTDVGAATLIGTVANPATKTYTDATTTDGVDYYYAVTAVDVTGNEDASVTPAGPVQSVNNLPPPAITSLTAQDTLNDDGGSIDLDWSGYVAPADTDHYNVYRASSSFTNVGTATLIGTVANPATQSYTDTTTTDGADYYYAVTAVDVAGNENPNVTSVGPVQSLDNMAPAAPTDVAAADTPSDQGGSITVTWTKSADDGAGANDVVGYDVLRSTTPGSGFAVIGSVAAGVESYTDDPTTDGQDYYYKVRAKNTVNSADSAEVGPVQSLDNLAPAAPTNVSAADTPNDQGGSITVTWTKSADDGAGGNDVVGYDVLRSTTPGSGFAVIGSVAAGVESYTDDPTTDGQDYYYVVRAKNSVNSADSAEVGPVQSVDNIAPAALTDVSAADTPNDDGGSIDLDWSAYSAPPDADHYNIYRATSSFTDVSAATLIQTITGAATQTYSDNTTTDGVDYYYAVTAVDVAGNEDSTVSPTGPVQSVNNLSPPAVTTLVAQDVADDEGGSVSLDWSGYAAPADADEYRIYRATSSFTDIAGAALLGTVADPAVQSYTDATATDGVDYYYAVTAADVAGNENSSVTAVGPVQSVNNLAPSAITALVAQDTPNDAGGSIDLDWAAYVPSADIDHYDVYRSDAHITSVVSLTPLATVAAPATAYTDAQAAPATYYYYAVVPVDVAGNEITDVTDAGPVRAHDNLAPLQAWDFDRGLRLLTLPATPADPDLTVQDIFGTTKVAAWDAPAQEYVYYTDDPANPLLAVGPGVGLWVDFGFDTRSSFNGRGASTEASYEMGVAPGWNLAGNPWLGEMVWSSVTATPAGSTSGYGWIYDPLLGYQLISATPALNAVTSIPESGAFWITGKANADKLVIAPPGAGGASTAARGAPAAIHWQIPVIVTAAGQRDACNAIGEADAALLIDNPPAAPGGVDAYLTPAGAPDTRAAYELRAPSGGTQVFDLTVVTGIPDTDVTVSLPDLSGLARDRTVVLHDLDANKITHVRTASSYRFNSGAQPGARRFAIEVRPAAEGALAITGLSAQPSRGGGGAEIRFELSQPAAVTVRVHNLAGRLVSEVQRAQAAPRGPVVCLWDGRSAMGTAAPSGQYILEVCAASEDGQRTRSVYPLTVRR